jgi:hypothetical protein
MSDEVDIADEKQQLFIDAAIMTAKRQAVININGDGSCIICGSPVEPVMLNGMPVVGRWCSAECRRISEIDEE